MGAEFSHAGEQSTLNCRPARRKAWAQGTAFYYNMLWTGISCNQLYKCHMGRKSRIN